MNVESTDLNLTAHRATTSVWDRGGWDGRPEPLAATRWLIGVGGAALAIQGLRQRSIVGSMLAAVGGGLAWWALSGESDLDDIKRRFGQWVDRLPGRRPDPVHDASADSFPASDPPAWTSTVGPNVGQGV